MRQLLVTVPAEFEDEVVGALQETCRLKNVTKSSDGEISRISCYVAAQEAGIVLHELDKVGCGAAYGKVAMLPVQLLKPLPNVRDRHRHLMSLVSKRNWTLRGRMATEEIYTSVTSGSALSFDYLAFVGVAGLIAAVGLATNSAVMIVASMLVSPLMGPILAFAFGTSVRDPYLVWKGVVAEAVGVTLTFLVGLIVGLAVCIWTGVAHSYQWPTAEMESRGQVSGLVVGVFFAVPSGAGVALSTTQGGTTALVGVAIAASLLPPVVNCGMCAAFAAAGAARVGMSAGRFARISWMSLALFLINVAAIYSVCLLFFWIKGIKKVRKQLSRYRDLPPLHLRKAREQAAPGSGSGLAGQPKHAATAPGNLPGYDGGQGPAPGLAGGGSAGGQAAAAVASATAAVGTARNGEPSGGGGEVVIKVGGPAALETAAASGSGARRGNGSGAGTNGGTTRGSSGGLLGNLFRLAGSGMGSGSGSGDAARAPAAAAAEQPPLRGWGRVRKIVLEDKALQQIPEAQGARARVEGGDDEESPRVHNI